ncbi:hypothetical protein D9M68_715510 [compost metagenome]
MCCCTPCCVAAAGSSSRKETRHESAYRPHESRDQHLLAGAHAAVHLRAGRSGLRCRRLCREPRQAHRDVGLHRPGRGARRDTGHAGIRHRLSQRPRGRRRLRNPVRTYRRGRAGLQRDPAGPAWRDGGGKHRRWGRGPAGARPPGRAGRSHRGGAGPARQRHVQDDRQCRRHHQFQDLSAYRHVRNRRARGPAAFRQHRRPHRAVHRLAPPAAGIAYAAQQYGRGRDARSRGGGEAGRGGRRLGRIRAGGLRAGRYSSSLPQRGGGGRRQPGGGGAHRQRHGRGDLGTPRGLSL